jgi:hypothetical protein
LALLSWPLMLFQRRPPRGRPNLQTPWAPFSLKANKSGHARLRDGLSRILAAPNGWDGFDELKLPAAAVDRYFDGDDKAFTPTQLFALRRFVGSFGYDGYDGRLIKAPRPGDPPGPFRPQTPERVREPHETESGEARRRRILSLIDPTWR